MARRARRPQPKPAPPAVPVDLVQAVVEAIARGELDGELAVLGAVINERLRLLATTRSVTTLASLRVATGCGSTTAPNPTTYTVRPGR
jgi:hypothetical protein